MDDDYTIFNIKRTDVKSPRRDERTYSENTNILQKNKQEKVITIFSLKLKIVSLSLQINYKHNETKTNSTDEVTEKAQITPPIFIIFMIKDFNLFIEHIKMINQQNSEFLCRSITNKLKINTYTKNSNKAINHNKIFKREKNKFLHLRNSRGNPLSGSNSKLTLNSINRIRIEELRKIGISSRNTPNVLHALSKTAFLLFFVVLEENINNIKQIFSRLNYYTKSKIEAPKIRKRTPQ